MNITIVLGTLIVLALVLAVGGGFVAARFLAHAAQQRSTTGASSHDR
ncbi:MAG TPA: hypothetical protein VIN70_10165 [Candidatus Limnocylindria bacterium]|jgi:hypothetical protein